MTRRFTVLIGLAGAGAFACSPARDFRGDGSAGAPDAESQGLPVSAREIPVRLREDLVEASGAIVSATQPGVVFLMNDSGHDPMLFAVDTAGNDRGAWQVDSANNIDWEAASPGPCPSGDGRLGAKAPPDRCLYIGDVGDNAAQYPSRALYRMPEPTARGSGYTGRVRAERLRFTYQDGPHDVEAMYVAPDGTVYLITKRRLTDSAGRPRPALVFAVSPAAWGKPDSVAQARLVDSLPVIPGSRPGRLITDAALSPDGRQVAVRTYDQVYLFAADTAGRMQTWVRPVVCNIEPLRERQGEGIAWLSSSQLLLVSEGGEEPLRIIGCRH
ncbi:MAG TPA: hypothetical protein VGA78_17810 [Gemmatimonadales bacterium]